LEKAVTYWVSHAGVVLLAGGISLKRLQAQVAVELFLAHNGIMAKSVHMAPNATDSRRAHLEDPGK